MPRSRQQARWGGTVGRGSVVKFYSSGGWSKGIVLRLKPHTTYSRAYGREAEVASYSGKRCYVHEVGVGDMKVIGRVKRIPKCK